MPEETTVFVKAFLNPKDRELGKNPKETVEVKTPEQLNTAADGLYRQGLFVGYFGKGNVRLASKNAALFILNNPI